MYMQLVGPTCHRNLRFITCSISKIIDKKIIINVKFVYMQLVNGHKEIQEDMDNLTNATFILVLSA